MFRIGKYSLLAAIIILVSILFTGLAQADQIEITRYGQRGNVLAYYSLIDTLTVGDTLLVVPYAKKINELTIAAICIEVVGEDSTAVIEVDGSVGNTVDMRWASPYSTPLTFFDLDSPVVVNTLTGNGVYVLLYEITTLRAIRISWVGGDARQVIIKVKLG